MTALYLADDRKGRRAAARYTQAALRNIGPDPAADLPLRERVRRLCADVDAGLAPGDVQGRSVVVVYSAPIAKNRTRAESLAARADAFTRLLTAAATAGYTATLDKSERYVKVGEGL